METTSPTRVHIHEPRVRDRIVRMVHSKVSGAEPLPTQWESSAPSTGLFLPTAIRVTYSRDTLRPDGSWDVVAVASGPVIRKDGTPGSRAATRTWARDAEDTRELEWPDWIREFAAAAHPVNLPSVPA